MISCPFRAAIIDNINPGDIRPDGGNHIENVLSNAETRHNNGDANVFRIRFGLGLCGCEWHKRLTQGFPMALAARPITALQITSTGR